MIDQMPKRDDAMAVTLQILEMGFEGGCGDCHAIGSERPKPMVEENRHTNS